MFDLFVKVYHFYISVWKRNYHILCESQNVKFINTRARVLCK